MIPQQYFKNITIITVLKSMLSMRLDMFENYDKQSAKLIIETYASLRVYWVT